MKISSTTNPHVKNVVKLRHSHHRKEQNRFIIEGPRCIGRAAAAGVRIVEVFICDELLTDPAGKALAQQLRESEATCYDVPPEPLAKMTYRDQGEGILAVAVRPELALAGLPESDRGLYIVAESLEKPGNLGGILRSADAAGADGLILCDRRTDVYNPNAITASTGTVFTVPIAEATTDEAVGWLRQRHIRLVATVCEGGRDYVTVDWTAPMAIVLGAEHSGISEPMLAAADLRVTIPMRGVADSINVAATATILLFEAASQRRGSGGD